MEEVVAEHLGVEHPHALGRQRAAVDAGSVHRSDVVGGNAAHPLQGQCTLGGVGPDHLRHVQIVRMQPEAAQHAGVGALALQVQLRGQGGLDLGHHLARADLVGARMGALDQRGSRFQQGDVGVDLPFDVRAQHLDHHFAAVVQRGRMHLRDRSRGQRRGVETGEGDADRLPQAPARRCAARPRRRTGAPGPAAGSAPRPRPAASGRGGWTGSVRT